MSIPASTDQQKQVLIVVDTLLGYRTLRRYWSIIADDPRVAATLTFTENEYDGGVRDAVMKSGIPVVSVADANARKWDLGLFATDQGREHIKVKMPKIKVPHGIGSPSKLYDGFNFAYSRIKLLDDDGVPFYDLLLEPSRSTADLAVTSIPELQGRMRVTGSMDIDELARTARRRNRLRKDFGFGKDDVVILLSSTWNEEGLLLAHGDQLIESVMDLPPNYKALMTVHPNLLAKQSQQAKEWHRRLTALPRNRFRVCGLHESWMPYLAVADVAVIDHSSIGLYFNSLRRPIIGIPISPEVLDSKSSIAQVLHNSPVLDPGQILQVQLDETIASFDPSALDDARQEVSSFPGEARSRVRDVLMEALGLDQLARSEVRSRTRPTADAVQIGSHEELASLYGVAEQMVRDKRISRTKLRPRRNDEEAQLVLDRIESLEAEIGSRAFGNGTKNERRRMGALVAWAEECRLSEAGLSILTGTSGHGVRAFWGRTVMEILDRPSKSLESQQLIG